MLFFSTPRSDIKLQFLSILWGREGWEMEKLRLKFKSILKILEEEMANLAT